MMTAEMKREHASEQTGKDAAGAQQCVADSDSGDG
jgi:hypothetical protein